MNVVSRHITKRILRISAYEGEKKVGWAQFIHSDENIRASYVGVDPLYRRKKIATKIYDLAEQEMGRKAVPSRWQSIDAKEFWKHREKNS